MGLLQIFLLDDVISGNFNDITSCGSQHIVILESVGPSATEFEKHCTEVQSPIADRDVRTNFWNPSGIPVSNAARSP